MLSDQVPDEPTIVYLTSGIAPRKERGIGTRNTRREGLGELTKDKYLYPHKMWAEAISGSHARIRRNNDQRVRCGAGVC